MLIAPAGFAQVQVSEEPMHHKVFDNGWVRVLDVHVPAGDTSLWHKHSTPSVFLILSATKTGSEVRVEPKGRPAFTDGKIWFEGFYDTPRIHRVWNEDDHEFHVIDMELPHKPYKELGAPFTDSAFHLLFDERPVRGYRMTLAGKRQLRLKERQSPVVIICVDDGAAVRVGGATLRKKGDYVFVAAGGKLDLVNEGQGEVKMAVFELK
jgi:quercetin dioxygenase-like cupin family protein